MDSSVGNDSENRASICIFKGGSSPRKLMIFSLVSFYSSLCNIIFIVS